MYGSLWKANVPYRGTAQAVNDLVAGNVDMLFFQLDSVREQYRANKVKMLAVTTATRIASVPEVPTMEEAGVKDFRSDSWNALAAPRRRQRRSSPSSTTPSTPYSKSPRPRSTCAA